MVVNILWELILSSINGSNKTRYRIQVFFFSLRTVSDWNGLPDAVSQSRIFPGLRSSTTPRHPGSNGCELIAGLEQTKSSRDSLVCCIQGTRWSQPYLPRDSLVKYALAGYDHTYGTTAITICSMRQVLNLLNLSLLPG